MLGGKCGINTPVFSGHLLLGELSSRRCKCKLYPLDLKYKLKSDNINRYEISCFVVPVISELMTLSNLHFNNFMHVIS